MEFIKKLKEIFFDKDFDDKTTESKVLTKIDKILEEGPIDNIESKDEFIKYIFRTYYYKRKYKPFVSYLEIIFKYYLIVMLIFLILISIWGYIGLPFNYDPDSENIVYFTHSDKYKHLWVMISNIVYFSFFIYILIRIYSYIIKLIKREVNKNLLKTFLFGFIKIVLFNFLIAITWFIGQFLGSVISILGFSGNSFIEELLCNNNKNTNLWSDLKTEGFSLVGSQEKSEGLEKIDIVNEEFNLDKNNIKEKIELLRNKSHDK